MAYDKKAFLIGTLFLWFRAQRLSGRRPCRLRSTRWADRQPYGVCSRYRLHH